MEQLVKLPSTNLESMVETDEIDNPISEGGVTIAVDIPESMVDVAQPRDRAIHIASQQLG
jgi:hypothetical protein